MILEYKVSEQTYDKIVGYIFLPQDANTYQKILIGLSSQRAALRKSKRYSSRTQIKITPRS